MNIVTTLVKSNSRGKPQFLKLTLDGPTLHREWGLIGGKVQSTSNTSKSINVGKANQQSPTQAAEAAYLRLLTKKLNEGYIQTDSLDVLPDLDQPLNIDLANIPVQLCCSKPHTSISEKLLDKLIQTKKAKFFIKYNGLCHYILVDPQGIVKIFTRRWHDHTAKYPEIVQTIQNINVRPGTLMITEFVIDPSLKLPHMEAFALMSSISKVDTVAGKCAADLSETFERQKRHRVKAMVFGMLFYDNQPTWELPYAEMWKEIHDENYRLAADQAVFVPTEVPITSAAQAFEIVKKNKHKIEGLIVWDIDQSMKLTLNGKPDRCACYKIKAKGEKDVIAAGWEEGTGKLQGKIGSLKIGQYSPTGEWIDLGTVAGLKHTQGECDPANWTFPCVIEVEYDQIFPDTGKFQFGHFVKVHEDKLISDVDPLIL